MSNGSRNVEIVIRSVLKESFALAKDLPENSQEVSMHGEMELPTPSTFIPSPLNSETMSCDSTAQASLLEKVGGLFNDDSSNSAQNSEATAGLSTSSEWAVHSDIQCICFNCWGPKAAASSKSKTWKSPHQPVFPMLPVFVRSPIDSLQMYGMTEEKTQKSLMTSNSSTAATVPEVTITSTEHLLKERLIEENQILEKKVRLQHEIIQKLIELSKLSERTLER